MTNEQAAEYIRRLMEHYDNPIMYSKESRNYRYCGIWLSDMDMIALKLGIEALKEQEDGNNN